MELTKKYPIQVLISRRIVKNKAELLSTINGVNGVKDCFYSLYQYDEKLGFTNSEIDKVWFDFDDSKDLEQVLNLHYELSKEKLKHLMCFSGRGFHVYIFCKNGTNLKNNKATLLEAHEYFINKYKLNADKQVIGDVARISRYPNTWNIKRKRYCIPISEEDLQLGIDYIKEKAKKQNFKFNFYGEELLDISKFDSNKSRVFYTTNISNETSMTIVNDKFLNNLPLCVASIIQKGELKYRERMIILTYFKEEMGLDFGQTMLLIKPFLLERRYEHITKDERHTKYLYKNNIFFPKCNTIKSDGYCIKGCKHVKSRF